MLNLQPTQDTVSRTTYSWQRVATDLFMWKNTTYLLLVDYYSRYIEISSLSSTTSKAVIQRMKIIFGRHGIPECLMSDNGPQFSSHKFQQFSKEYKFDHKTSSPNYPQANGEAERAVQTVKTLLNKNDDPHLALLAYRSTPLANGYSPAELLMGRKLRTTIPIISANLHPKLPDSSELKHKEGEMRQRQNKTLIAVTGYKHCTHYHQAIQFGCQSKRLVEQCYKNQDLDRTPSKHPMDYIVEIVATSSLSKHLVQIPERVLQ